MIKNNTNYTVKQLTDKLTEVCENRFPSDRSMKWAYICGVLEAMLDWENKGYSSEPLQNRINDAYLRYEKELQAELVA
jgi:hypothetical protein